MRTIINFRPHQKQSNEIERVMEENELNISEAMRLIVYEWMTQSQIFALLRVSPQSLRDFLDEKPCITQELATDPIRR